MGIRTPDLLIANETLYQLSYTPNLINFRKLHNHLRSKKDACLYRHEINGNYYAIKKIRSKIKTHALRSESRIAITDRKLAERKLREWLPWEREDELSTLRAFFQIIG
jgi:hypothetical protein